MERPDERKLPAWLHGATWRQIEQEPGAETWIATLRWEVLLDANGEMVRAIRLDPPKEDRPT